MGKTRDPLSLRVHPQLLPEFQKEIEQGHDVQAIPPELQDVDFVVCYPEYGVFKQVIWAEAKRRHKLRKDSVRATANDQQNTK